MKKLFVLFTCSALLFGDVVVEDAWRGVKNHSEGMKVSQDGVKMAELKKESARSMYLPSVTLTGSYTHLSEALKIEGAIDLSALPIPLPGGDVPYSMELSKQDLFLANLHMLWPLYTGGRIDAAQSIYAAQLDEEKAKAQMKEDKLFVTFVKYYYGVVVAESLYATRLKAQEALKLHYENAKKLQENAQIANIELLAARVKYENAKIETTKAKHRYETAQSALHVMTGSSENPASKLFVYDFLDDEQQYETQTLQNYSALKIFDAKEKQSEALVDVKKALWHPEVVAVANYNLYKDDSILMQTLPRWFAGVIVKIDILKRENRAQETQIARLLSQKVKHARNEALEALSILVKKTYKEMMAAKEEYEALSSSLSLARENYRLRELSFNEGLSTSVEVMDAQTFLEAVETKRLNAAYEFVQKLSHLCVLSGEREKFFEIESQGYYVGRQSLGKKGKQ